MRQKIIFLLLLALVLTAAFAWAVPTANVVYAQEPTEPPTPEPTATPSSGGGIFGISDLITKMQELIDLLLQIFGGQQPGQSQPGSEPVIWDIISRWFYSKLTDLYTYILWVIIRDIWFLEKLIALVVDKVIDEDLWLQIWTPVLDQIRNLVGGGGMSAIMFGAGGIMYVALGVAGLAMIVPSAGGSSLAKPDRVLIWGAVVLALFVSSGAGVDLIGQIELLRMRSLRGIMASGPGDGADPKQLVTIPMKATTETVELTLKLPADFETTYFPTPVYEEKIVTLYIGLAPMMIPFNYESDELLAARKTQAETGMLVNLMSLPGAFIVLLFGISFASLSAGAIMLMVFFIAALPLGFFEFGAPILMNIVKQYVYLFALTLLVGTLTVFLIVISVNAFPTTVNGPQDMLGFIPIAVVVAIMMSKVSTMAVDAIGGSSDTIKVAVSSVSSMAYQKGDTSKKIEQAGSAGLNVLMTMGMAAATGGASAVIGAGTGAALGMTKGGRRAGQAIKMAAGENSRFFQNMGTAAIGGNSGAELGVLAANMKFNRRDKAKAEGGFASSASKLAARVDPHWKAVDKGQFMTTDLRELDQAEHAFFKMGNRQLAKTHLERAYGSPELADKVLTRYEKQGEKGARQVRTLTETAQSVAVQMDAQGKNVFDNGQQTDGFRRGVQAALLESQPGFNTVLFNSSSRNEEAAKFIGEIAGATVRRPSMPVWASDEAPRELARQTLDPDLTRVKTGDMPAMMALRDKALELQWGPGELTQLYSTVREAMAESSKTGQPAMSIAAAAMQNSPLPGMKEDPNLAAEVSRLAVLAADGARIQQPLVAMDFHPADRAYPASQPVWDAQKYDDAVDTFYHGRPYGPEDAYWAGTDLPPPPAQPPTPASKEWSRKLLIEATGSHLAADKIMGQWEGGTREDDARQLGSLMGRAQSAPVITFTGAGSPAFAESVKEAARQAGETTPDGEAFFDQVSDSLLWEMREEWVNEAGPLAQRIMQEGGQLGPVAGAMQYMGHQAGWSPEDMAAVVREAMLGTPAAMAANLPPFENMNREQVTSALALGRDVAKEQLAQSVVMNAAPGSGGGSKDAAATTMSGGPR